MKRSGLNRLKSVFGCLFFLISLGIQAQVETKIDKKHIKIGEPIDYTLSVPIQSGSTIQLPQLKDTLSFHIEILDQKIDTVYTQEEKRLVQHLKITGFDSGEFLIRSLPVVIDTDTLLSHSFRIQIDEVKIDSANLGGFPIKTIMDEEMTWKDYWDQYWPFLALILVILLVLLLIFLVFIRARKQKKENSFIIKTPYEEAIDALKALDKNNYLEKKQLYPFYSDLSYLLRRYLGRIYGFGSLELLSDDLVEYFRKTTHLDQEEIEQLKLFLYDSDLVKYAKAVPNDEKHAFYRKWVEELIERTRPMNLETELDENLKPEKLKYRVIKDGKF